MADYTRSPTGSLEMGKLSSRSVKTGPGSRGGRWHDPEFRRAYQRAWRASHPEYRERERLRRHRERLRATGADPADTVSPPTFPRPLPVADHRCPCACGCRERVPVVACGFCVMGEHA